MKIDNSFWEHLAKHYPSHKDASMGSDVRLTIKQAEKFGIDFRGKSVIDIGCGTGTVAIPLAKKGANITAVDISRTMLKRLEEAAILENLHSKISTTQSDWDSYPLNNKYDIVLASMSPAVSSDEQFEKYLKATKEYGIFVGWGAYKRNEFVNELLLSHKSSYKQTNNKAKKIFNKILSLGYEAKIKYFETTWSEEYSPKKAREYAIHRLKLHGVKLIRFNQIDKAIKNNLKNGKIFVSTTAQKGIITWKAK